MQFVMIRFKPNQAKLFTYHNDTGVKAVPGDRVDVDTDRGWVTVDVVEVSDTRPTTLPDHIKTKPILKVRPAPAATA